MMHDQDSPLIDSGDAERGTSNESIANRRASSPTNIEYLQSLLTSTHSALWDKITIDTLRPLPLFLGITGPAFCFSPDAFNPPSARLDKSTTEKIHSRLNLNIAYFITNYAMLASGVTIVVALMYPKMVFYVTMVSALWWLNKFIAKNDIPLVIFGKDVGNILTMKRRTLGLVVLTVFVVVVYCLLPAFCAITISGSLILLHALLRDPKHIESSRVFRGSTDSDDEGESSGEEVMVSRSDASV